MNDVGAEGADTVLVGVTGSQTSLRAAAYATGLARRQHARLILAKVRPPAVPVLADPYAAVAFSAYQATQSGRSGNWDDIRNEVRLLSVEVEFVAPTGDPYRELHHVAERVRADVVVLGATTSRIRRLTGLSVSCRFLHAKRWPVVIVP